MTLHEWAAKWRIPYEAVADLQRQFGMDGTDLGGLEPNHARNETGVAASIRVEAARKGLRLWRNNVGAMEDATGRHVRFGLANDSAAVNARIKSADLIGIRPVVIEAHMLGHTVGQFVSREVKAPGWHYIDTPREQAQKRWAELVVSLGGDACFATSEGTL